MASEVGLLGLTIGHLAKRASLSKSGLYAHFSSKEKLQIDVIDEAARQFEAAVIKPAIQKPRGLPRIEALFCLWLDWTSKKLVGGCPIIGGSIEFDDRPGAVRDRIAEHLQQLLETVARSAELAVASGHLRKDLDAQQFAFELWSIILGFHTFARLVDPPNARLRVNQAFQQLVAGAKP